MSQDLHDEGSINGNESLKTHDVFKRNREREKIFQDGLFLVDYAKIAASINQIINMSTTGDNGNDIRCIDLSFIGLDIIIINGEKYIEQACNSGDLYKVGDVCKEFEDLPWLFRVSL